MIIQWFKSKKLLTRYEAVRDSREYGIQSRAIWAIEIGYSIRFVAVLVFAAVVARVLSLTWETWLLYLTANAARSVIEM